MGDAPALHIEEIDRNDLIDSRGRPFKEFKRQLRPRFAIVWRDIALGYLALLVIGMAMVLVDGAFPRVRPLTIAIGALGLGYFIAYLHLFLHEAAHYNIAPDRAWNDRLANLFIGVMAGEDVRAYRPIHFDHHRHLGTPQDTERSYFEALSLRFIVESMTGIRILRVIARRQKQKGQITLPVLAGAAAHVAIVVLLILAHQWPVAVAWVLGMGLVHPFLVSVRQLVEHRSFEASSRVDYAQVPHGAVTRTFGGGPVASTLGGAGFNRHFLHHWEPQISYTRFAELEAYVLDSAAAANFRQHSSTYVRTVTRLMRAS
jgi:fatty acid desaturase